MASVSDKLMAAISQAASQYFRLVLLAGPSASGKTAALQSLAKAAGYSYLNINLELSKRMLELARKQRARQVERLLKEVVGTASGDVALLDNTEILFDASLEVEPLRFRGDRIEVPPVPSFRFLLVAQAVRVTRSVINGVPSGADSVSSGDLTVLEQADMRSEKEAV
jgi:type II secretory pathway predicted ATPase ExeA